MNIDKSFFKDLKIGFLEKMKPSNRGENTLEE